MNLLVIVDMVNGFAKEGVLADPKINNITPNIIKLVKNANNKNIPIIAFRDCHSIDDEEFRYYPPHCLDGTKESELIDELKVYENSFCVIKKDTTNGFITKKFTEIVNKLEFDTVEVCGCLTEVCVKNFIISYIKFNKLNNRKTVIKVVDDACATFDAPNHNAQLVHKQALKELASYGAIITTTEKELEHGAIL